MERLVQEYWMGARVLFFASKPPNELREEALFTLIGCLIVSRLVKWPIPINRWNPNVVEDFLSHLKFGQTGFAFSYRADILTNKKLLPRSEFAFLVSMESGTGSFGYLFLR